MKNIFQFLNPYIRKNRKTIALFILASILLWATSLVMPYLFGIYIDFLLATSNLSVLVSFVAAIALVNVLKIVSAYITSLFSVKYSNSMQYQIQNDTCQRIFSSKLSAYHNLDKSYLIDQIRTDSESVTQFFTNNITNVALQFVTIAVSAVIVFQSDKILCGIMFCLIPIYIFLYILMRQKMYHYNLKYKKFTDEYFSRYAEQMNKLEFVKRHMLLQEMYQRLQEVFRRLYNTVMILMKTDFLFRNLGEFFSVICYVFILALGGYRVFQNELSIGRFTMINTYFTMIIASTSYFLNVAKDYQDAKIAVQRFSGIYETDYELYGSKKIETLREIQLKSCSVSYDQKSAVFEKLSCRFEKGKIYGILGHNGAGKTTLLNCLTGLCNDLILGEVLFDDIPITVIDTPCLRRNKISLVEQFPDFLNLSIEEYLSLGVEWNDDKRKLQAELIQAFQLDSVVTHTDIREGGSNFSGGEKQKLSIVRALSRQGILTILDEPTSALDNASVETLIHLLNRQKNNTITLVVTHDARILDICDETIRLSRSSAS